MRVVCPGNHKRTNNGAGDWSGNKGCSVVKYDPEHDVNFHDIDPKKVEEWIERHKAEYVEDMDLIKMLKSFIPKDIAVYTTRGDMVKQKSMNKDVFLLYSFHSLANKKYLSKYGDDDTVLSKEHRRLKSKVKRAIKKHNADAKKNSTFVGGILSGLDFSDIDIGNDCL